MRKKYEYHSPPDIFAPYARPDAIAYDSPKYELRIAVWMDGVIRKTILDYICRNAAPKFEGML